MSTLTPPQSPQPVTSQAIDPPSCPAIAFQIAGQWLAIPYAALLQVVHKSALNQNLTSETLAYLGKQPLAILNLHSLLTNAHHDYQDNQHERDRSVSPSPNPPFLVLAAVETAIVGISVNQLPILLDLPLAETHALPPRYYNAIQGIASHVVTVPQLGGVLLLNLQAVIP